MINSVLSICKKTGIKDISFCPFSVLEPFLLDCRAKKLLLENSKTVILFLFPYKVKEDPPENISRYAAVPDYHKICMPYLKNAAEKLSIEFKENKFVPFIDNSPIPEVRAAAYSGLGVMGENGLLINPKYGSFVFIGEIVTDLEIPCEISLKTCSLCGVCKSACPIGVRKDFCLSAVSQQKKELSTEQKSLLKRNNILWGCDICAENCPMNKNAELTYIDSFIKGYRNSYLLGEDISDRAFEWRGEKVIRRNAEIFLSDDIPDIIK